MFLSVQLPSLGCKSFRLLYVPRQIALRVHLKSREAISHEAEGVCRVIRNVKVFCPNVLEQAVEQMSTTAKQGRDSSVNCASLVPAATSSAPDKRLVDLIAVLDEVIHLVLLGNNVLDVFSGNLLDPLDKVIARPVQ